MEYPAALRKKAGRDRFLLICFLYDMVCLHFLRRGPAAARSGRLPVILSASDTPPGHARIPAVEQQTSPRLGRWPLTPPDAPLPVGIPSVSLCRYEHSVLSPPQLATGDTSLRRCSDAGPSRLARRAAGSITLRVAVLACAHSAHASTAPSAFISPARRLGAGLCLRGRLDIDLAAGQLRGQARVLPLLADGQRELVVRHDDAAAAPLGQHLDGNDVRR